MPVGKYIRAKTEARRDRTIAFAKEHPSWTRRKIAAHLGISLATVANDFYERGYHQREYRPPRRIDPREQSAKIEDSLRTKLRALILEEFGSDDPEVYVPLMREKYPW